MKILKMREPAPGCYSVEVRSDTRPDITYYVQHRDAAFTICSCPDFMYRAFLRGEACKHMQHVFEAVQKAGGWAEALIMLAPLPPPTKE
jgi:hypothetical protein